MRLQDFAWLADENIHPDVTAELRCLGYDVSEVRGSKLAGVDDTGDEVAIRVRHLR